MKAGVVDKDSQVELTRRETLFDAGEIPEMPRDLCGSLDKANHREIFHPLIQSHARRRQIRTSHSFKGDVWMRSQEHPRHARSVRVA
jgi:hypothetical protein